MTFDTAFSVVVMFEPLPWKATAKIFESETQVLRTSISPSEIAKKAEVKSNASEIVMSRNVVLEPVSEETIALIAVGLPSNCDSM